MAGGGSNAPAAVAPTVNTSNVQHSGSGMPTLGGTTGGKSGGQPQIAPHMAPNQVSFGGYGQASPYGQVNNNPFAQQQPSIWGTGGVQNTGAPEWQRQNQFNPNEFAQSQQSLGGGEGPAQAARVPNQAGSVLSQDEYAAATPDTQANSMLNTTGEGAQAGGVLSGITGKGDDWGSSLATGAQSNVGLQDRAIALGETVGGFSPLVGAVTGAAADRVAPKNQFQKDNRTAQEVSIDRHTKRWQDSNDDAGPLPTHQEILDAHALKRNKELGYDSTPSQSAAAAGFDMNNPDTWLKEEDKVDLKKKGSSQSSSNDSGGGSGGSSGGGK